MSLNGGFRYTELPMPGNSWIAKLMKFLFFPPKNAKRLWRWTSHTDFHPLKRRVLPSLSNGLKGIVVRNRNVGPNVVVTPVKPHPPRRGAQIWGKTDVLLTLVTRLFILFMNVCAYFTYLHVCTQPEIENIPESWHRHKCSILNCMHIHNDMNVCVYMQIRTWYCMYKCAYKFVRAHTQWYIYIYTYITPKKCAIMCIDVH